MSVFVIKKVIKSVLCYFVKWLFLQGTTGTQASFLQLFQGDHDKVKELDRQETILLSSFSAKILITTGIIFFSTVEIQSSQRNHLLPLTVLPGEASAGLRTSDFKSRMSRRTSALTIKAYNFCLKKKQEKK